MQVKRGTKDKGFCEIMADNYLEKKGEGAAAKASRLEKEDGCLQKETGG